jgi:ankyrin repeat protein
MKKWLEVIFIFLAIITASSFIIFKCIIVQSQNSKKYASILEAVEARDIQAVRNFIAHGASVQKNEDGGCAPLHLAAWRGDVEMTRLLLEHGADVHTKRRSGETPLHESSRNGSIQIAELLIKFGADVDEKSEEDPDYFNPVHNTPLHEAARCGNLEMVQFLIRTGANIDVLNAVGFNGETPLANAIIYCHLPIVNYLLEKGAKIEHINLAEFMEKAGDALNYNRDTFSQIIKICVSYGANINDGSTFYGSGRNLLIEATAENNKELILYLLQNGAEVNDDDSGGRTALHYATEAGNIELAKTLLHAGANINKNAWGGGGNFSFCGTPLMCAARENQIEMVRFLLEQGADITIKEELMEETALSIAQAKENKELIELLMNYVHKK